MKLYSSLLGNNLASVISIWNINLSYPITYDR